MSSTTADRAGERVKAPTGPIIIEARSAAGFVMRWSRVLAVVGGILSGAAVGGFVATVGVGALGADTRHLEQVVGDLKPLPETVRDMDRRLKVVETATLKIPEALRLIELGVADIAGQVKILVSRDKVTP